MPAAFTVSTDPHLLDRDFIHGFLRETYWAKHISRARIDKQIEHSLNFGLYGGDKRQIGFCRVITDYSSFAWLADVFIGEAYRNKGLAKQLLEEVFAHPSLQGIRLWTLGTRDAHELYHKYGFKKVDELFMVRRHFAEYKD